LKVLLSCRLVFEIQSTNRDGSDRANQIRVSVYKTVQITPIPYSIFLNADYHRFDTSTGMQGR